jgi:hypothetical protein
VIALENDIRRLGGIAKRSELLAIGHSRDYVDLLAMYRTRIECIRKGWFADSSMPVDVLRAWRAGGRLACISAALHLGAELPADGVLHVSVPRNGSRLPPHDGNIIYHWTDSASVVRLRPDERASVKLAQALEQALYCRGSQAAAAQLRQRLADERLADERRRQAPGASGNR